MNSSIIGNPVTYAIYIIVIMVLLILVSIVAVENGANTWKVGMVSILISVLLVSIGTFVYETCRKKSLDKLYKEVRPQHMVIPPPVYSSVSRPPPQQNQSLANEMSSMFG